MLAFMFTIAVGLTAGWVPAFFVFCAMWAVNLLASRNVF